MSYNRGSSRRGGRGGTTTSSSSYRRRRNSGWNSGSDSSARRANRESRYTGTDTRDETPDVTYGIPDSSTGIYNRSSDYNSEPQERRNSSRNARKRKHSPDSKAGLPGFNWKIVVGVLIAVGIVVAIIFAVSSIKTDGMLFSKLGENVKQFSIKMLWMLVISILEWALVAFTIFKDSGPLLKIFVFIGVCILVLIASFKNIIAIVLLGLLTIGAIVKFIFFRD